MKTTNCKCGGSYDEHDLCFECDKPKPVMGRPSLGVKPCSLTLTEAQVYKITKLAKKSGTTKSEVVRALIDAA